MRYLIDVFLWGIILYTFIIGGLEVLYNPKIIKNKFGSLKYINYLYSKKFKKQ